MAADGLPPGHGPEGITRPPAGFVPTGELLQVALDARHRVAVIELSGRPAGTGFLVAPDVLLTASHVVGTVTAGRLDGVRARFDFVPAAGRSAHETGMLVDVPELLCGSGPADGESGGAVSPVWDAPTDRLDFVLLRLTGRVPDPAGSARGHYTLDESAYDLRGACPLLIVQHPLGMQQSTSHITAPPELSPSGTRMRYAGANTLKGSSGSPIVDMRGRLVGVHHYAAGPVNQGVPAWAVARALADGPYAGLLRPAPPDARPRPRPPVMLSWVPGDRHWAEMVHGVLSAAGHDVLLTPDPARPGSRTLREHAEGGGVVFAVVSPAYLADPGAAADRDHVLRLDHRTPHRRLVPVLVEGELTGTMALLDAVDLRGASAPGQPLLTAAARPAPPPATRDRPALAFRPGDPLPRLRRLSDRARRSAGTVSGTVFGGAEQSQFAAGLYVTRDLEEVVAARLAPGGDPLVVAGEPGCGKTSLLWGLAQRLCANPDHEVFFVKATWLAAGSEPAQVDAAALAEAVGAARDHGRAVTLLLDTVDVLVNNDDSWNTLVSVVESAVQARAAVVMTSRISEATELPSGWPRFSLRDYATEPPAGQEPSARSEFARAVLAHSAFFTADPLLREDLVSRMLAIVARDVSLTPLCLRPLTLRMLFEIYTPGQVSGVVDTTGLYEAYWDHRVLRDRRSWDGTGEAGDRDRDLGDTAAALALEMLRTGLPEARVAAVRLPPGLTSARLGQEIALLQRRGVGRLAGGVFQFFHQTFFEYAASRALIARAGAGGIRALIGRVRERADDDYFLLAVLEQAWLCADRTQEVAPAASAELGALLSTFARDTGSGGGPARYGLRRTVLSVAAQGTLVTGAMRPDLLTVLAAPSTSVSALGRFLALLPCPGRDFGPQDTACLTAAVGRPDNAWLAVVEVLGRLLSKEPARAVAELRGLGLVERSVAGEGGVGTRGELPGLLVVLLVREPGETLPLVREVVRAALRDGRFEYAAEILGRIAAVPAHVAAAGTAAERVAWAAEAVGSGTDVHSALIKAYTTVLEPWLRARGHAELLGEFGAVAGRLASGAPLTTADRALLGAVLGVAGECWPAGEDPEPFLGLLARVTRQETLTELSRGGLVRLLDSPSSLGDAARALAARWLAEGLPLQGRGASDERSVRAKAVMAALGRTDLSGERFAAVATAAAAQAGDRAGRVWERSDCLLPLLVRGVAAGVPAAVAVADALPGRVSPTGKDVTAWVDPHRRGGTAAEAAALVDVLLRVDRLPPARKVLEEGLDLDGPARARLGSSALASFRAAVPPDPSDGLAHDVRVRLRSLAAILAILSRAAGAPAADWKDVSDWIGRLPDRQLVAELIGVVGVGLEQGVYPAAEVVPLLRGLCGASGPAPDPWGEDSLRAKRWCLWWYGEHGTADDVGEAVSLAFAAPADARCVKALAAYALPGRRGGESLSEERTAELILAVGRGIRDSALGGSARKDVGQAWRRAFSSFLPTAATGTRLRLVLAAVELDDKFAAHLVQCLPLSRTPELRAALQEISARPTVGPRLQGVLGALLDRHRRVFSDGGWPSVFDDLAAAAV
ncbi:trypsin-like peptidase domain-containing protein [Streptomyces sp. t39]|uniref:trypsin-like peptidase domain-containing protein n=1 Tax=Streptomyces sp. t39 TaxID=1828156 RepID=UPI0011CE7323|nr:trypsin-like peptidase domain-containing protein [Streptomyces sp. t39]TXS54414.1 TIR domain-containing protein [Streptomyces sp. t39]